MAHWQGIRSVAAIVLLILVGAAVAAAINKAHRRAAGNSAIPVLSAEESIAGTAPATWEEGSTAASARSAGNSVQAGYTPESASSSSAQNKDYVIVYLFHGDVRCPTCIRIERTTREVITNRFAQEISQGRVVIREVNVDQPQNAFFIRKYELVAPTVVMARYENDREIGYANLMQVWQLVHFPELFARFIEDNLRAFLEEQQANRTSG
jgi:hypothetical protein